MFMPTIISNIEKSNKRLEDFRKNLAENNFREKQLITDLIKSQSKMISALTASQHNYFLLGDTEHETLGQHINRGLEFADNLLTLMLNDHRLSIVCFDIKQLIHANNILTTAIQSPGEDHNEIPNGFYSWNRFNEEQNGLTRAIELNKQKQVEHLPWREDLRLHLKKNLALATIIAISVAVIILAATLPPLAALATLLIPLAGVTIFTTLLYKAHKDVYPLSAKRVQEELRKDTLYQSHLGLFNHQNAAYALLNIRKHQKNHITTPQ